MPKDKTPDHVLLEKIQSSDIAAFGELVRRHQNLVCSIAYSIALDRGLSEDVAQETFLALWERASTVRDSRKVRAWLCTTTRNLAKRALRRLDRETKDEETIAAEPAKETPFGIVAARETSSVVRGALAELPETYRETLVLFYREDQKVSRIADGLGLSIAAVKQRLSRGRKLLRERLIPVAEELIATAPTRTFAAVVIGAAAARAGVAQAASAGASAGSTSGATSASASASATSAASAGPGLLSVRTLLFTLSACVVATALLVGQSMLKTRAADQRAARVASAPTGAASASLESKTASVGASEDANVPPSAVKTVRVEGQVIDHDGEPISGALVALRGPDQQLLVVAEDDGSFVFESVGPGNALISASRDALVSPRLRISLADDQPLEPVILRVAPGVGLEVAVLDSETLDPVENAMLFVSGLPGNVQSTNDEGIARLAGLEPTSRIEIEVHATGFAVARKPVLLPDGTASIRREIHLVRGQALRGIVIDATGKPVPGAQVGVERPSAPDDSGAKTTTDGGGRFEFVALRPGEYRLSASYGGETVAHDTLIEVSDVDVGDFSLQLKSIELASAGANASGDLEGVVVDQDGNPVVGATVRARRGMNMDRRRSGVTDSAGKFRFAKVAKGNWTIRARWPGEPAGYSYLSNGELAAKIGKPLAIVLNRPGKIRATVKVEGKPVKKLWVAISTFKAGVQSFAPAIGCSKNRIELDTVPPGTYVLSVFGPDFAIAFKEKVVVESDKTTKLGVIRPKRGSTTRGKVVSADGKPVAGARVFVGHPRMVSMMEQLTRMGGGAEAVWKGGGRMVTTDRRGRFNIKGISPGPQEVMASHKLHGRSGTVKVDSGATLEIAFAKQASLSGTITRKGKSAPNATITLKSSQTSMQASANATGYYRFDGVAPGRYKILVSTSATLSDRAAGAVDIASGEAKTHDVALKVDVDELELRFPRARTTRAIYFIIRDQGTTPTAATFLSDPNAIVAKALADAGAKRVLIPDLQQGSYYACSVTEKTTQTSPLPCHPFTLKSPAKKATITLP